MTYVKNEKYYGYDERYPENKLHYLDGIDLVFIPDNANLQAEFMAGGVDLICANSNVFDMSEQAQIRDTMSADEYDEYQQNNTVQALILNQNIEALQDIRVRKALQYAINLDEIAVGYYNMESGSWSIAGMYGEAITGYSSVANWSDELKAEYNTYDPELAKQLLEEAGYGDGLTLDLIYFSSSRDELLMLIQNYLAQVGVTMTMNPVGHPSEIQGKFDAGDCMMVGTNELGMIDISQPYPTWRSGGFNYRLSFCDELDVYMDAVNEAKTVAEAEAAAQGADEFLMAQHYALAISPVEEITFFASSDVGGYNGQMLWQYWNATTVLPRLWNTTA